MFQGQYCPFNQSPNNLLLAEAQGLPLAEVFC